MRMYNSIAEYRQIRDREALRRKLEHDRRLKLNESLEWLFERRLSKDRRVASTP